jgi:putative glutamine amidotransferase
MPPCVVVTRGLLPVRAYSERLRAAGAEPIEVAAGAPFPRDFDALCLSGGPDVHWSRYGQERNGSGEPDEARDALELDELLPIAFNDRRPILAICRGLQVLNVHLNGTLVQDMGEDHRAKNDDVKPHPVRVDPSSRLAEVCGTKFITNSRHHQVIDRLGSGLRAVAWADGYIEGAELTGDHWVVGVQWHPERIQDRLDNNGVGIFEAFVRVAERVPAR